MSGYLNILTLIVCGYLLIAAIRGCVRGCLRTVLSMVFLLVVIVLTLLLTPFVSKVVAGSHYVQTFFSEKREQFLSVYMNGNGSVDLSTLSIAGQSIRESPFRAAAAILSILLSAAGVESVVAEKLVSFMIGVTATVLTFFLVFFILGILRFVFGRSVRKRRGVSALDHALGLPIGLARGLVVVWIFLGVVNLLAFMPQLSWVARQITASPILSWLNGHNLIVRGLTAVIAGMLR